MQFHCFCDQSVPLCLQADAEAKRLEQLRAKEERRLLEEEETADAVKVISLGQSTVRVILSVILTSPCAPQ